MSSTKILENPATTMLGTTSARLTTTSSPTAGFRTAQFAQQQAAMPCGFAARLPERFGALHGEHDAGEREIEFGHVDPPPPDRGIVDIDAVAVDAFQHHEMVEVPVNDAGHRQLRAASTGSLRKPLADRPKLRAALTMLLALLPSRETPHAMRSCSSGIQAP